MNINEFIKNKIYTDMGNDFIDRYRLHRLTKDTGEVGRVKIYGTDIALPASGRFHLFSISGLGGYNLNLTAGQQAELRHKWIRADILVNSAPVSINLITSGQLLIPTKEYYFRITDNGVIILCTRILNLPGADYRADIFYLHSYVNTFLSTQNFKVERFSVEYDGISSVLPTASWSRGLNSVYDFVNGYLVSSDIYTDVQQGDFIDTVYDEQIVDMAYTAIEDCGPYRSGITLDRVCGEDYVPDVDGKRKIACPINIDTGHILNFNDIDVFLVHRFGTSYYGVLLTRNTESDMRTLTYKVIGISSRLISKAAETLENHPLYESTHELGFMFLIRGHSENDKMVGDILSTKTLHSLPQNRIIEIIGKDIDRAGFWRGSNLEMYPFSHLLDKGTIHSSTDKESAVQGIGYESIIDLIGKPMHDIPQSGEVVTPELYLGRSIVIEYDDDGLVRDIYGHRCEDYIPVGSGRLEFIRGRISPSLYLTYNDDSVLPAESRIYELKNEIYQDITDDSSKITISDRVIQRASGYNKDIYYKTIDCIYRLDTEISTRDFIIEDAVIELPVNYINYPIVFMNNRVLLENIEFTWKDNMCFIHKPLSSTEESEPVQNITLLFRSQLQPSLETTVVETSFIESTDFVMSKRMQAQDTDAYVVTIGGTRIGIKDVDDYLFNQGDIYTIELVQSRISHMFDTDTYKLIGNQLRKNEQVNDFMENEYPSQKSQEGITNKTLLVSPFMNRVLNIALLASDSTLNSLVTYTRIRDYLEPYAYILKHEPKNNISDELLSLITLLPSPSVVQHVVTTAQYNFLKRVSEQYGILVDLENTLLVG